MTAVLTIGSTIKCAFGAAPGVLLGIPTLAMAGGMPIATITMFAPIMNIPPFGLCTAPSNPAVIAALGSPVPCMPVTVAPWSPGASALKINGMPAALQSSKCNCAWGGVISVTNTLGTKCDTK